MRRKLPLLCSIALTLLMLQPAVAQSVPTDKQAEVAIQLKMDKFRNSPLYDTIRKGIENSPAVQAAPDDFDWESVDSLFVAFALPEDISGMMALQNVEQTGVLPIEIFAKVTFSDVATAEKLEHKLSEKGETTTISGETWYTPPADEDGPKNIVGRRDGQSMLFATRDYVELGLGKHLMSAGLQSAMDKMPNDGFRLCVDLQNCSALVEEVVAMGKENGPPMAGGMLDLLLKANNIRLSLDLADGDLLTLAVEGKDEQSAVELKGGLDGMLGMAKMMGGQGVEQLKQADAQAGGVLEEILNSLNAEQDGMDIIVAIPRPEGFNDAVRNMAEKSGMGGPPKGGDRPDF